MEDHKYYKFYERKTSELLVKNKYANDFAEIILTQQTDTNPTIYSGPGSIYQDDSGNLTLKLYHVYTKDNPLKFPNRPINVGKLIGKEHSFKLNAIDMSGDNWCSKDVWVNTGFKIPSAGKVIEIQLSDIEFIKPSEKSDLFDIEIMAIGKYDTPPTKYVEFPDGSQSRSMHTITIGDNIISTIKTDDCLYIQISGKTNCYTDGLSDLIVEAISVAIGCKISVTTISTKGFGKTIFKICSNNSDNNRRLNPPIRTFIPGDGKSFTDFIQNYLISFKKPWCLFHMYWYKIYSSSTSNIENIALIQSTVIEGVLKEYFYSYGTPTKKEMAEIDTAVAIVNQSDLDDKMKERVIGHISMMKSQNPRRALIELKEKGYITDSMVKAWRIQRHSLAHGKIISSGGTVETQKVLDDSNIVLSLFYRLLLIHIGYSGEFYDYSSVKWPLLRMADIIKQENPNAQK